MQVMLLPDVSKSIPSGGSLTYEKQTAGGVLNAKQAPAGQASPRRTVCAPRP